MPVYKKRVLLVSEWFPPAFGAGGPVVSVFNLAKVLQEKFEVRVVTSCYDIGNKNTLPGVSTNIWQTFEGINVFYQEPKDFTSKFLQQIHTAFKPHVVWISGLLAPKFSILPHRFFRKKGLPVILSVRGMLHSSALQVKSSKKELFLKLSKLTKVYKNTIFHVTNHEEKEFLNENFLKDANFFVLPNIPVKLKQVVRNLQKNKEELILSFVGRIAAEKNALFALKVLEASKNKQIELNFYGVMPNTNYAVKFKDKLMEMQQRGFAVNYKGLLHKKELSRVFAKKTHFLFSPTKGENFGHAIIESLSNAVPVVISNKTPWKNIEVEKAGFVLENKIEAQIQILNLLFEMGNECYQLYSENSVKYVQENPLLNNLEEQYLQQVSTILTLTQNE